MPGKTPTAAPSADQRRQNATPTETRRATTAVALRRITRGCGERLVGRVLKPRRWPAGGLRAMLRGDNGLSRRAPRGYRHRRQAADHRRVSDRRRHLCARASFAPGAICSRRHRRSNPPFGVGRDPGRADPARNLHRHAARRDRLEVGGLPRWKPSIAGGVALGEMAASRGYPHRSAGCESERMARSCNWPRASVDSFGGGRGQQPGPGRLVCRTRVLGSQRTNRHDSGLGVGSRSRHSASVSRDPDEGSARGVAGIIVWRLTARDVTRRGRQRRSPIFTTRVRGSGSESASTQRRPIVPCSWPAVVIQLGAPGSS